MKIQISKKMICIITLFSFFSISGCEKIDKAVNQALDETLGISALSEELDKTSSNYNLISDIVINNKLISSSEISMILPSSVSISYTKKRYTLTGSRWDIVTNSYSGTLIRTLFNKKSNVLKIKVQNNIPNIYVNDVSATLGASGGTGTTLETKLIDIDVTGLKYQLKTFSVTVPTGVKTIVFKTHEPNVNYRNLADLFVRKGIAPIVSKTATTAYTWTSDYTSQTPNREQDIITISNPSSGTWYVGLFGYNSDFNSRLVVSITK